MENILNVVAQNGENIRISVIDIFEGNYQGVLKKYIVYSLLNSEDILISILNEDENSFRLDGILSDEEFKYVENMLLELNKEDSNESV